MKKSITILVCCFCFIVCIAQQSTWEPQKAFQWYHEQGFLIGCNFIPSTAVNQLEMWQSETFDTSTISRELGYAASIGMNCVRVFLHDLAFQADTNGFLIRLNTFLSIADRSHIKTLFVFFDSCWDPFPKTGKQPEPVPFRHNSHWVQSPGYIGLKDTTQFKRLEEYVKTVVKLFANDQRILGWDVWNEPDYANEDTYGKEELPNKNNYVKVLLKSIFFWVRSQNPTQPITSPIWKIYDHWSENHNFSEIEKIQITESDVISFHFYRGSNELEKRILWLKQFNKPILCTEYLARSFGSTFSNCLPVLKKNNVASINWGLVSGKTNTIFPWDSWHKKYQSEPILWHHDIFRSDGSPYSTQEVNYIKSLAEKQSQ